MPGVSVLALGGTFPPTGRQAGSYTMNEPANHSGAEWYGEDTGYSESPKHREGPGLERAGGQGLLPETSDT